MQWSMCSSQANLPISVNSVHRCALLAACLQVAVDQLTYGPLCNLVFMAYTALVVGGESPLQPAAPSLESYMAFPGVSS